MKFMNNLRIVTVHRENGQISGAAAGSVSLQDAPMRMALQPQETSLAVALGDGGILKFSVARDTDGVPVLHQLQGDHSLAHQHTQPLAHQHTNVAVAVSEGCMLKFVDAWNTESITALEQLWRCARVSNDLPLFRLVLRTGAYLI